MVSLRNDEQFLEKLVPREKKRDSSSMYLGLKTATKNDGSGGKFNLM